MRCIAIVLALAVAGGVRVFTFIADLQFHYLTYHKHHLHCEHSVFGLMIFGRDVKHGVVLCDGYLKSGTLVTGSDGETGISLCCSRWGWHTCSGLKSTLKSP